MWQKKKEKEKIKPGLGVEIKKKNIPGVKNA